MNLARLGRETASQACAVEDPWPARGKLRAGPWLDLHMLWITGMGLKLYVWVAASNVQIGFRTWNRS